MCNDMCNVYIIMSEMQKHWNQQVGSSYGNYQLTNNHAVSCNREALGAEGSLQIPKNCPFSTSPELCCGSDILITLYRTASHRSFIAFQVKMNLPFNFM